MKRLDGLGLTSTKWLDVVGAVWGKSKNQGLVCVFNPHNLTRQTSERMCRRKCANARLAAAAPDLYEALREAVIESCHDCDAYDRDHGNRCGQADGSCFVQRWRKALEKAGGRETPMEYFSTIGGDTFGDDGL